MSEYLQNLRDSLRARGLCIGGAKHGPAVPGAGRCQVCIDRNKVRNTRRRGMPRTLIDDRRSTLLAVVRLGHVVWPIGLPRPRSSWRIG